MPDKMPNSIEQYNDSAKQFADAVMFEKAAIIAPALQRAFERAVHWDNNFDPQKDKIIDIGCGPFLLALPFLTKGIHVDGVDIAPNMLEQAQKTLARNANVPVNGTRLVDNFNNLAKGAYSFAMMNFVHQCCVNRSELDALFRQANELLKAGSSLVLIGSHPDFLHVPHSACAYNVAHGKRLADGELYTGTIYNYQADETFDLKGDYYWSKKTLLEAGRGAGFEVEVVEPIEDLPSLRRPKSKEPAYIMMIFSKPQPSYAPGPA